MEITVLTPQDLELLFDSNPEQFSGFLDMPYFLVTKVRPVAPYRQLYRVYAMVPYQIDPQHAYVTGIFDRMFIGRISKAGLDYLYARYPGRVFVNNRLHS